MVELPCCQPLILVGGKVEKFEVVCKQVMMACQFDLSKVNSENAKILGEKTRVAKDRWSKSSNDFLISFGECFISTNSNWAQIP